MGAPVPLEVKPSRVSFHSSKVLARDQLLEQGASSSCGETALSQLTLETQEAIRCRCAHGKQLPAALEVEVVVPMPRKPLRQTWGERA